MYYHHLKQLLVTVPPPQLSNTPSRDSGTSDSSGRCGSTERHNCEKTDREAITKEKTNEHRSRPESRVMNTHQESQETEINTTKKIKVPVILN